ncbi:hypothetical protein D8M04_10630 [Oceanobacillus piezotolerans]|uniref:EscU/YscU/HrcU family type III secretion system export apparatus switch protein n=1 Tax=Oceanobacillus piezotolerans TaxID=2448030 RepID=A0A498DNJ1_9BACI|nr:EscU/YscU/HrcU family type III secretion system export apparatus switch protein [Oceanobacillus piezotolerans]RLL45302.1 hypothetical protein D8M04_10630 [Oceanobacillus piezotolerans]
MSNIRKKAAALQYDEKKLTAPIVSATGKGLVAEEILEVAKQHNIPIIEDSSLVELLAELNINEAIPEELYEVVAEIFAFIYRTDQQVGS